MVVDASILQVVSTLHVVVTMLSVWQEHTASVCDAYTTIAVDRCTTVYVWQFFRLQLSLLCLRMVTLSLYRMIDVRGACDLILCGLDGVAWWWMLHCCRW